MFVVRLVCNDCKQEWDVDELDDVELTPKDGPYRGLNIKFNFGKMTKNMSSCPNCGSYNTKEV